MSKGSIRPGYGPNNGPTLCLTCIQFRKANGTSIFVLIAYGLTQILVYSDMPIIKKTKTSQGVLPGLRQGFSLPHVYGIFHVGLVFAFTFSLDRTIYV